MNNVQPLNRFIKASDLRDALVALIAPANATITNRNTIEKNLDSLIALESELRRFGVLNQRQKWYGSAINVTPTLEKSLNKLGYSTKSVKRERSGRQVREVQFIPNPMFDLDQQTKQVRIAQLFGEIEQAQKTMNQKILVLRQMLNL